MKLNEQIGKEERGCQKILGHGPVEVLLDRAKYVIVQCQKVSQYQGFL